MRKAGKKTTILKRWTRGDLRDLRAFAGKHSVARISHMLKRSPAAIRYKAHTLKLSLRRK